MKEDYTNYLESIGFCKNIDGFYDYQYHRIDICDGIVRYYRFNNPLSQTLKWKAEINLISGIETLKKFTQAML